MNTAKKRTGRAGREAEERAAIMTTQENLRAEIGRLVMVVIDFERQVRRLDAENQAIRERVQRLEDKADGMEIL